MTMVGKSWDLHVHHVLETTLEENLAMIARQRALLRSAGPPRLLRRRALLRRLQGQPDYALARVGRRSAAGAEYVVLCDTNGGTLPWEVEEIVARSAAAPGRARRRARGSPDARADLGIHTHDDGGAGGGQRAGRGARRLHPGAGHDQRLRRAGGQLQPLHRRCPNLQLKMGYAAWRTTSCAG